MPQPMVTAPAPSRPGTNRTTLPFDGDPLPRSCRNSTRPSQAQTETEADRKPLLRTGGNVLIRSATV